MWDNIVGLHCRGRGSQESELWMPNVAGGSQIEDVGDTKGMLYLLYNFVYM